MAIFETMSAQEWTTQDFHPWAYVCFFHRIQVREASTSWLAQQTGAAESTPTWLIPEECLVQDSVGSVLFCRQKPTQDFYGISCAI